MENMTFWRRAAGAVLCAGLALLLTGCLLSPGKFVSTLDLRKDGQFTFTYQGEIYLLGLSRLAEMGMAMDDQDFVEMPCYDEDTYEDRPCSEEDIEQQRSDWDARQASRREEQARNSESFSALLGGLDPSDPQAAEELAARLRRQHGWNSVTYQGDGVYVADFSITSRMSHDFSFPTIEGFTLSNAFVSATIREGNVVRIDAPGYSAQSNTTANPTSNLLQFATMLDEEKDGASDRPYIPVLDGTFTITTDGAILANNTDEGPEAAPGGQKLSWTVTRRTASAPMALIRLGN